MGLFEPINPQPSSSHTCEKQHESLIAFTFHKPHGRTGFEKNSLYSTSLVYTTETSNQKPIGNPSTSGPPSYLSDESSSVPQSTISGADVDEPSGIVFEPSTPDEIKCIAEKPKNLNSQQRQASSPSVSDGCFLQSVEDHQLDRISEVSSLGRSVTPTEQSATIALDRKSISNSLLQQGEVLQKRSPSIAWHQQAEEYSNDAIKEEKEKADKERGYLSDSEGEFNGYTNEESSLSSPVAQQHQSALHSSMFYEVDSKRKAKIRSPVAIPDPLASASPCDRWNPILVVANYSSNRAHGYIKLPKSLSHTFHTRTARFSLASSFPHEAEAYFQARRLTEDRGFLLLRDVFVSGHSYRRNLYSAMTKGIWFDLKPWAVHIFEALLLDEV